MLALELHVALEKSNSIAVGVIWDG